MKKTLPLIYGLTICFAGCGANDSTEGVLTLDAENAIHTPRVFDLSEIVKDVDFVILDSTGHESLIGNISRVRESRERFYISDGYRNPIRIFDKTGCFLHSVGSIGRGPNELPGISVFAVDYENDDVYILGGSRIIAYNQAGNIVAQNDSVIMVASMDATDGGPVIMKYSDGVSRPDGEMALLEVFSTVLELKKVVNVLDKGSTDVVSTLPNGQTATKYNNEGVISNIGPYLVVKETLNDTVFHYGANRGMEPAFRLDLGKNAIPQGATGRNPSKPWSDNYYSFSAIYEGYRYIISRANSFSEDACLFFDKLNPSEGFMVVGADGNSRFFMNGIAFTPCYVRYNQLVGYMQALDIVDNAASITNPDLAALAATLKEDSNPVIVTAKLK